MRVLGDVRLDKLTAGYIRRKFSDSGKGNTTLNKYLVRFKSLMRWAYKYDYISDIRFIDKLDRLPEPTERKKVQDKYLESSELSALIGAMEITRFLMEDNIINISALFFTQNGRYIHYDAYRQYLGDRAETSIGRRIAPHTLRHTHASLMLEAGMGVDAIAARLGHSSTRITRKIYLHVTEKLQEKRNAEIKNIRLII